MARPALAHPTLGEVEILQVVWRRNVATVRDIHDELTKRRKRSFTTVATIVHIMAEKKLLKLVDERRPQKFKAALDDKATIGRILDDLKDRWFKGSTQQLILSILAAEVKAPEKLAPIEAELKKLKIK